MKIERFYSSWNDLESKTNYHAILTSEEVEKARATRKYKREDSVMVFLTPDLKCAEVKNIIQSGYSRNIYRDLYRITD